MARRLVRPLFAYSESGQIPAYAVTSALVPISSNSGVSHFWSSMAITSLSLRPYRAGSSCPYRICPLVTSIVPSISATFVAQEPLRTEPETFRLRTGWRTFYATQYRASVLTPPAARKRRYWIRGTPPSARAGTLRPRRPSRPVRLCIAFRQCCRSLGCCGGRFRTGTPTNAPRCAHLLR